MRNSYLFILLFLIIANLACTENTENLVSAPIDEEPNEPAEQVSYSGQVQPIFNNSCTGCHGSSGNVNLSSYSALMNSVGSRYGSNVVVAGNADASGLVDKIEPNPQHGSRMPIGGSLTTSEIQTIRIWIDEGANNN